MPYKAFAENRRACPLVETVENLCLNTGEHRRGDSQTAARLERPKSPASNPHNPKRNNPKRKQTEKQLEQTRLKEASDKRYKQNV
ncbi:hypothetical protein KEJ32_02680 [Candidatus Bathyarchaeota archaeon]|nr:hypothetical protein [Candidatus Bathyarchaeota archaeon]